MQSPEDLLNAMASPLVAPNGEVVPYVPLEELAAALVARDAQHQASRASRSASVEHGIREWRFHLLSSLGGWQEPNGLLVPTEPDPEERGRIRRDLSTAITVLDRLLDTHFPEMNQKREPEVAADGV